MEETEVGMGLRAAHQKMASACTIIARAMKSRADEMGHLGGGQHMGEVAAEEASACRAKPAIQGAAKVSRAIKMRQRRLPVFRAAAKTALLNEDLQEMMGLSRTAEPALAPARQDGRSHMRNRNMERGAIRQTGPAMLRLGGPTPGQPRLQIRTPSPKLRDIIPTLAPSDL